MQDFEKYIFSFVEESVASVLLLFLKLCICYFLQVYWQINNIIIINVLSISVTRAYIFVVDV
jgi:hypothetical protein